MPPAQVQELVAEVKAWYETHEMLQRDLAAKLGVSPTGLCQIFAGINKPSASTTLAMIRFLEENQSMNTNYVDPRTTPRQAAGNAGPKTLTEARERIETLEAQLVQLRGVATAPQTVSIGPTPTAKPAITTPATPQTPAPIKTGNMVENRRPAEKAPVKKALPPEANTPVLIQRILDVTTLDDLLSMLGNNVHTKVQQACIYTEVRKRRSIEGNRFQ